MKLTITLATACALMSAPVFAQTPSQTNQPQTNAPQTTGVAPANAAISTPNFVNRIVMSDMFDVQAGRLAEQRGDSSDTSFARGEVNYHTKLGDEIKNMVNSGKVHASIASALDREYQQKLDQLRKLSSKQFGDAYKKDQVQNHETLVMTLQQYAQNGDNPELKQWASKTLPEVKQHLTNAEKLK